MDARYYKQAEIQYNESKRESNLQQKIRKQTLAKSIYETAVADEKQFTLLDRQHSHLSMANIYNDQGKYDLAREHCQKAIALCDANQNQPEFEKTFIRIRYFMLLAIIDSSCNQVESAIQNYRNALRYTDSHNGSSSDEYASARQNKFHEFICHVGLFGIFKSLGFDTGYDFDKVKQIYRDVEQRSEFDFEYFYGVFLVHNKEFFNAVHHFEQQELTAFHYDYALAHLGNLDYTQAIREFTSALDCCTNDNDKAKCYFGRAKAHHRNSYRQDTEAAIHDIHQALELFSDNLNKAECFSELASIYVFLNRHDDAITAYRKFIFHHTDGFQKGMAYKKCAELYEQKKDIQQAIAYYGCALLLLPPIEKDKIYRSRGLHYQTINEDQKAIDDFTKALHLNDRKKEDLYLCRGMSYQRQKNYPLAIADLVEARRRFLGSEKNEAACSFAIAICYQQLEDHAPALDNYKTAFIFDPALIAKLTATQLRYFIKNHADYYRGTLALCLEESQKLQAQQIIASIRQEAKPQPKQVEVKDEKNVRIVPKNENPPPEHKTNKLTAFFKPKSKTTKQDRPLIPKKSVKQKLSSLLFKSSEQASSSELLPLTGRSLTAPPPSPTHK